MGAQFVAVALVSAAVAAGSGQVPLPLGEALVTLARRAGADLAFLGPAPTVLVTPSEAGDMSALVGLLDRQGLSYALSTGPGGTTRVVVVTAGLTSGGPSAGSAAAEPLATGNAAPAAPATDVATVVSAPGDPAEPSKPELPGDFVSSPEVVLFEGGADRGSGPAGFQWSPMEAVGTPGQTELPGGFVNTPPRPSAPPGQSNPTPQ